MVILNILLFLFVLGIIILVHEAGHFFFAKRAGILCHEFAIGMGPVVYQKRKGETVYSIRGIPIGGFVSMAGEAVSDALINKEQVIGLRINEQGNVYEIILTDKLEADVIGKVVDYDLYGKDFNELYIDIEREGVVTHYPVVRDAVYQLGKNRTMWITPEEKSFESKTLWQRFLVVFGGPMMNFILAFLIYLIIGWFVLVPTVESNEIADVAEGYSADMAGIEAGDQITSISVDGTAYAINSWSDLSLVMDQLATTQIDVTVLRDDNEITYSDLNLSVYIQSAGLANLTTDGEILNNGPAVLGQAYGRASSNGRLEAGDVINSIVAGGVTYDITSWDDIIATFKVVTSGDIVINYTRDGINDIASYSLLSQNALEQLGHEAIVFQLGVTAMSHFDFSYSLLYAPRALWSNVREVFVTLGLLFSPAENLGIGDLSGPVGIFSLVSSTASQGFLSVLALMAFLSVNIGLLNLLPIPALDGGRLVFLGYEAVTRRPINRKVENWVNTVMFFALMTLFVFVTYNDIVRLIFG